ncbi:MAG: hypothetical protein AAB701_00995 [Patescibacteria group bacterium]
MTVTRRASALTANQGKKDDHLFADLDHAHRRRGLLSCRNLGCVFILAVALGVLGLFGIIAETGLVVVPVLSSALYQQPPKPFRAVEPAGQSTIESLFVEKLKDMAQSATGGKVQLSLTEAELTKLAQEPRANGKVPVKQAQVTIEPTFVELYGFINMPNGEKSVVLRIRLEPDSHSPQIIECQRFGLGTYEYLSSSQRSLFGWPPAYCRQTTYLENSLASDLSR